MSVRQILEYPNKQLRERAEQVAEVTPEIEQICTDLVETARAFGAQGLAAPQIGENKRIFVYRDDDDEFVVCINPSYWGVRDDTELMTEGCLSFPGVLAKVERFVEVDVEYTNLAGETVQVRLAGVQAVAFQHEFDHLDGILFTERMSKMQKRVTMKRFEKVRRRARRWLKQIEEMMATQ